MIEICALASGSNGNCYYVGNEHDAVLIDVGISRNQVLERINQVGLDFAKVRAVFITHEHSDHSRGVRILHQKFNLPVYMTAITFNNSYRANRPDKYVPFLPNDSIKINSLLVHTFSKLHDAVDPCSFVVEVDQKMIGVITDVGMACENVKLSVNKCHALFLESNYDEKMLWDGSYPIYLKNRVASKRGHLSNDQARDLIMEHAGSMLDIVMLSHLSADNNTPQIALNAFSELIPKHKIILSDRLAPSEVIKFQ